VGQGPHYAEEADQRLFAAIGGEVGRAMAQSYTPVKKASPSTTSHRNAPAEVTT